MLRCDSNDGLGGKVSIARAALEVSDRELPRLGTAPRQAGVRPIGPRPVDKLTIEYQALEASIEDDYGTF